MKDLIVIPAYNEERALPGTLASLQVLPSSFEILVVNDGSQDGTEEIARRWAQQEGHHLVTLPINGGIGVAVQTGYRFVQQHGGYRYVIQFDADGQHDAGGIEPLVMASEKEGLDLCIGSRFLVNGPDQFHSTLARRMGIRCLANLIRLMGGVKITDPTSGFRCAGPRAWRFFAERYPEDYPEPESVFWCIHNGLRVGEIPARMHERRAGVSSIQSLMPSYYMAKVSLAICVGAFRAREVKMR